MTYEYPRGVRGPALHDVMLGAAWLVFFFLVDLASVRALMLAAIPIVLGWGFVTLHFPASVAIDDAGVTFARYGRGHHFSWKDVTRVRVRRFLVRDRVLVRIEPTPAWRGRYWIVDSIDGFEELVAELERRGPHPR